MTEILLCTLNAKYIQTSLGLRYLRANLGEQRERSAIHEFTINQKTSEIVEEILRHSPRLIGFGVYIWNLKETESVLRQLKSIRPELLIVLGGPELSHHHGKESICQFADCTIGGEADLEFPKVCQELLDGGDAPKFIQASSPSLEELSLPYYEYTKDDLTNRLIYVEASRGCPYRCEFCLSSLDKGVRDFPLEDFLTAMSHLLNQGCSTFKFVDRTFNLKPSLADAIMNFFLKRMQENLFLHFEMVPDRLPDIIKERLPHFPAGSLQFEIGIQTLNPEIGSRISRKVNPELTFENLTYLKENTQVHLHLDLIVGLPGESLESIAHSFNQLWTAQPNEIQVGILKNLKGTPIARHATEFGMIFSPEPPYEILQNKQLSFQTLQELKRFARVVEIYYNGGRFPRTLRRLTEIADMKAFQVLFHFSKYIWQHTGQTYALSLPKQISLLEDFSHQLTQQSQGGIRTSLLEDLTDPECNPKLSKKGIPPHFHQDLQALWPKAKPSQA